MTNTILTYDQIANIWIEHGLDECDPEGFASRIISATLAALVQRAGVEAVAVAWRYWTKYNSVNGYWQVNDFRSHVPGEQPLYPPEAIAQLQATIEVLRVEVERLTADIPHDVRCMAELTKELIGVEAERDQLRAQLEAQWEAVELIVNGRNVFDIDPSFVWSFLKLRSKFDAELMKAAWDALVLAAKATLSQHPAATHPAPAAPVVEPIYSLDVDPQGIRARVVSAAIGAMAYGANNTNKPPEGHWLNEIWNLARAEREDAVDRVVTLFEGMETPYLPDIANAIDGARTKQAKDNTP